MRSQRMKPPSPFMITTPNPLSPRTARQNMENSLLCTRDLSSSLQRTPGHWKMLETLFAVSESIYSESQNTAEGYSKTSYRAPLPTWRKPSNSLTTRS